MKTEIHHESKQAALPKCDVCELQPLPLMMHQVPTPMGLILGVVACAECGHVVHVLVVGMQEAELVDSKGRNLAMVKPS